MLDRLGFVEGKYEELTLRISDPNVIADHEVWQKLVKEHSDLQNIVTKYREYKGLQEELDANMEMLQTEDDQDIREMINEDVKNIRVRLEDIDACTQDKQKPKDGK